jgi:GAF domain-containing protein
MLTRRDASEGACPGEEANVARELHEARKQQMATAEILRVIRASPNDVQPVFETIVRNAVSLCGGLFANVFRFDGELLHYVASHNVGPSYADILRTKYPMRPNSSQVSGRVVLTKSVVWLEDALTDPEYDQQFPVAMGWRRLLGVPMLREGEPIGVIGVGWAETGPASKVQEELLKTFADQAAIAIENVRLFNEAKEALERQTATAEILGAISGSPTDTQPVFDAIVQSGLKLFPGAATTIVLPDGDQMRAVAIADKDSKREKAWRRRFPSVLDRTQMHGTAILDCKVIDFPDVEAHVTGPMAPGARNFLASGYRAITIMPMIRGKTAIGAISVVRVAPGPLSEKQRELLKTFAAQAVIAIENTRLLNELRESLQQQTATADVLKVISRSTFDLQTVLDTLLESAVRLCEARLGALFRLKDDLLHVAAHHNFDENQRKLLLSVFPMPVDRGSISGRAVLTGAAIQIPDILADNEYRIAATKEAGFRSLIGVPLLRNGQAIGSIVIYRMEAGLVTDKQLELIQTFADQAVIAIENTRLLNELRQRTNDLSESLEQQTATSDVLRVISSSPTNVQPVFDSIAESSVRLCDGQFSFVLRFDGTVMDFASCCGLSAEGLDAFHSILPMPASEDTAAGRAIVRRAVVEIPDVEADPSYGATGQGLAKAVNYRSIAAVPLLNEGNPIGAIAVARANAGSFPKRQIVLLQAFADQAVIAIKNVRLFDEVQARTRDLSESLEQQTATSEVLKVVSGSPGNLEPVFDAMLQNAVRICGAKFGNLMLREGDAFRLGSTHGAPQAYVDYLHSNRVFRTNPGLAQLVKTKEHYHLVDIAAAPTFGDELREATVHLAGARTLIGVPMLKDDKVIGAIIIYRQEVRPFTNKQIELVKNFAAQAVIAIENTRLLNELRESLQQQTATADVLKVISRSAFDLRIVLRTLVESAAQLCEAQQAIVTQRGNDGLYRLAASFGYPEEFDEYMRQNPLAPGRATTTGRVALEGKMVHIPDVLADPEYAFPKGQQLGGYRSNLGVPLLRDGVPIGAFVLMRPVVKPFSDKQIELVETFADQAVIAIENVRLLNELRESLQQQTATADVLKVISRSTFDLQTVLDTLVESAARLCEADSAAIHRPKGDAYPYVASYGLSHEYDEYMRKRPLVPGRGTVLGRAVIEGRPVHVHDVTVDPEYTLTEGQRLGGFRTVLGVPLMREGTPIGIIMLTRNTVRPFTDKQIELVTTFADQAAIAIENVRLFESVEARTRELAASLEDLRTTQDRLVQTQKLASLGQLTAGIAHEIKNPLNFVNNFSAVSGELIDDLQETLKGIAFDDKVRAEIDELTKTLRSNLDKVVQHGKRADGIVKNMLLHSREGSGEHRPVDINALVEDGLNLAYHGARAEKQGFNISLERSFDPTTGEADIFPQDITRVLLNLISNGFYAATKRGAETNGGDYEPTLAAVTKNRGDCVEITIRDNGMGIPADVKEKMFNPFFTTKPAGEGTGLGLSISHDIIVKQHGGSIEVETQPGEFTEIKIVLPRAGPLAQ